MTARHAAPTSSPTPTMRSAALRRALLPAVAAAAAFLSGAPAAGAQTVQVSYAPSCGPTTPCSLLRFQVVNADPSALLVNTLTLAATSAPFRFAPAAGGVALYQAVDAVGPFGGSATVAPGGGQLLIDFLGGNGFAFELGGGGRGYVEVPLAATPPLSDPGAFTFSATLAGGRTVSGAVAVIPEPTTVALLGGGLAAFGLAARRRRAA